MYIAIEGVIGVGKTTLARMLKDEFEAEVLMEVFDENPFLTKFYEDRERYAFQTQIFFLLSRYDQQTKTIPAVLAERNLITDYTFSKDALFAAVNLEDDELTMYQEVHEALAEKIEMPDLLVYLKADTDVLMKRIAKRDRSYERNMDVNYIDALNQSYDAFFEKCPLDVNFLVLDTNEIDFVQHEEDFDAIVERIKQALKIGPYQSALPL